MIPRGTPGEFKSIAGKRRKDQEKMGRGERKGERIISGEKLEMEVAEVCRQ